MDHKLCKDCKGFCCDDIGLPVPPQLMENSYHRWLSWHGKIHKNGESPMSMSRENEWSPLYEDIFLIYPMLEYFHKDTIHPDGDVINDSVIYHYKCKHHRPGGGCGIYNYRPMMCRTFPDQGFCGYKAVTIQEVIDDRPDWFDFGMTMEEQSRAKFLGKRPDDQPTDECPTEEKT